MENKELLNFYGAKPSKSGNGFNVTLVKGRDDAKQFFNAFIKNENAIIKDGFLYVRVKMLEEKPAPISEDELPF